MIVKENIILLYKGPFKRQQKSIINKYVDRHYPRSLG